MPYGARRFYTVLATAMFGGLAINFAGLDSVKMLFWSAILNGALTPPLILLVVLLTSNSRVMRERVNSSVLRILGWITFALMSAVTVGMILS
jgi:Mn2+/Fe2+ NRAMP family transporter